MEGNGVLHTGSRKKSVEINGIRWLDHLQSSGLGGQLIHGSMDEFASDQMGVLLGSRVFTRLNIKMGERIRLVGGTGTLHLRVCGVFETGVSQIDKNRIYLHMGTARSFLGQSSGGSVFQLALKNPKLAPDLAVQLQTVLHHRVVSWQEREKVWLDVFKALRVSSAITVSCILLLSGLGIFNVFAILVIEKNQRYCHFAFDWIFNIRCLRNFSLARGNSIICRCCDRIIICMCWDLFNLGDPAKNKGYFFHG